ncbi:hypothetical protein C8Q80DRAFT_542361 [Daedaleopsis nitida]|nr:hypothetical protein C8Q80DRAFT_542361 [Daedaleopsis nitida]
MSSPTVTNKIRRGGREQSCPPSLYHATILACRRGNCDARSNLRLRVGSWCSRRPHFLRCHQKTGSRARLRVLTRMFPSIAVLPRLTSTCRGKEKGLALSQIHYVGEDGNVSHTMHTPPTCTNQIPGRFACLSRKTIGFATGLPGRSGTTSVGRMRQPVHSLRPIFVVGTEGDGMLSGRREVCRDEGEALCRCGMLTSACTGWTEGIICNRSMAMPVGVAKLTRFPPKIIAYPEEKQF